MNGVSARLSPAAIVTGKSADARLHCRASFGDYCQVYTETTNNAQVSRTVGAICLGPTGNKQGTHFFLSVLTGKRIKGHQFTVLPMPDDVIHRVESFAPKSSVILKDIEFRNRNGVPLLQEWIDEADDNGINRQHDNDVDSHDSFQDAQEDEAEEEDQWFDAADSEDDDISYTTYGKGVDADCTDTLHYDEDI